MDRAALSEAESWLTKSLAEDHAEDVRTDRRQVLNNRRWRPGAEMRSATRNRVIELHEADKGGTLACVRSFTLPFDSAVSRASHGTISYSIYNKGDFGVF